MPATVSVLIAAYNAAPFLPAALESLRRQNHRAWELILVEDGSDDGTADLLRAFAAEVEQPVRYENLGTNRGVAAARNRLLERASGDFVAFLDADDLWEPDHLAYALELMAAEGTDWFIAGLNLIDPAGRPLKRDLLPPPMEPAAIPTSLLRHNFILTSGIVARAALFAGGPRFDTTLRIGEDLDLCIELVRRGHRPSFSPRATLNYRKHPASTTADPVRFPEEFAAVFEKHLGDPLVDRRLCRRLLAEMLLNVARMTWRREPARARAALRRLFRCDAWAVRAWPYFLLARLRTKSVA